MALPCFNEFYNLFYHEGKKVIPLNIYDLLTPLGLAFLICDDGSFNQEKKFVVICTDCFLESEIDSLMLVLTQKFELDCRKISLKGSGKSGNKFRIVIKRSSLDKLRDLCSKHLHSSMLYKLGL